MANLDNYIASLENLSKNLNNEVGRIVLEHEGNILGTIKARLFGKGLDANLQSLGTYLESTIKNKRSKGQRAAFVTLRDTGDFYKGMFIEYSGGDIIISSTDDKTFLLEDIYGEAILDMSEQELEIFIQTVLEPEIEKIITNSQIDL